MEEMVAIYSRLSDEDKMKGVGAESESIQNQKNLLTNYANYMGWSIYKIYSDDDWSGLDADRPDWNNLLEDAKMKKFNTILCKTQARFTRDMELVEKYLHHLFPLWGIRFIGLADNADTSNRGNKKQRQINGLVNEWYCEDLSNNIRYVFDNKRREGKFIGSFASYGYIKDQEEKGHLLIDVRAAEVVKRIYDLYLAGYGTTIIAKQLNSEGVPNPTLHKNLNGNNWKRNSVNSDLGLWNKTTVKRILKNQMYLGDMVQCVNRKESYKSNKQISVPKDQWIIIPNMHEAIVTQENFNTVQQIMKNRRRSDGLGQPHVLAGKVRCLDCGSALNRSTPHKRNGEPFPYKYLSCSMANKNPSLCKGHRIRLDKLENLVLERLRLYFKNVNDDLVKDKLKVAKKDDELSKIKINLNALKTEIQKKEKVLESLYVDKATTLISANEYIQMSKSFKEQLEELKNEKNLLESKKDNYLNGQSKDDALVEKIQKFKNADTLNHLMVNEFIEKITIGEKNKNTGEQEINIYWCF